MNGSSSSVSSSASLAAALGRPPSRQALQEHAAHTLALASALTLPPSKALAAQLEAAERRAQQATRAQQEAKEALLAHLDSAAKGDRALTTTLGALPEQIDNCDEAILALSSPASAALESSLHSHLHALAQLQRARDYFVLLAAAEDLRIDALSPDKKDVRAALPALSKLAALCEQSTEVLTDERIRAVAFIRAQRDYAFHELRRRAVANLRAACEAAGWSPTASAAAATTANEEKADATSPPQAQPARRLDAHKDVQHAWKDLCRFQRTAERLGLMPPATASLLRTGDSDPAPASASGNGEKSAAAAPRPGSSEYVPLLAVTVLLDVLLLRFRYHFDSSRPSNRLDKPEWYLTHILGLVRAYGIDSDLFRPGTGSVARLCALGGWGKAHGVVPVRKDKSAQAEDEEDEALLLDTGAELLHGLLVPLRAKLVASMPMLLPHPPLLAHTISEYILFDDALRTTFPSANLEPPHTSKRGPALSLADQVLNNSDWFAAWLEGERAHAEERLDEILNAPDAWSIRSADGVEDEEDAILRGGGVEDGERGLGGPVQRFPTQPISANGTASANGNNGDARSSSPAAAYKTVRSAQQIVELLDSVQERAKPLPLLAHRVAFFARIQLPLLRAYADRLARSLDAFESLSSAFARAMPGAIEGVNLAVAGAGGVGAVAGNAAGVVLAHAPGGLGGGGGGGGGGGHDADMVRGLRGLGRLLKAHLSAAHIVDTLQAWNETAFFLSLAAELRETDEGRRLSVELRVADSEAEQADLDKASLVSLFKRSLRRQHHDAGGAGGDAGGGGRPVSRGRESGGGSAGAGAGRRDRSKSASRAADEIAASGEAVAVEGGVWDDILVKYRALLRRSTVAMERLVVHEILDALKPYSYRRWDEGSPAELSDPLHDDDDDDDDDDEEEDSNVAAPRTASKPASALVPVEPIPTPTLLPALTLLSTHLGHLLPALPPKHALPVYRSIAGALSTAIVDRVVMSGGAHRFTLAGGQRFARDVETGWFGVLSDLMDNYGRRSSHGDSAFSGGTSHGQASSATMAAAMEALGRRPRAAWRELEGAGTLLSLPPAMSVLQREREGQGEKWTLESVTRALYEEDEGDDVKGWAAVRRGLDLGVEGAGGLTLGRAREVVRRRVECAR
ncbi:hypothetical protein OC835_003967 [Tilletia horrida]|nr:hypothetical protein OC835_003967 [Tilletia horrida]